MLKSKIGVFDRLSNTGFRIKRSQSRKASSHDYLLGSCPVIDADFVEVNEEFNQDSFSKSNSESIPNSESIDPVLLENLREYLKTRSQEEISDIFEEINRILERQASKGEFNNSQDRNATCNENMKNNENIKIKETLKSAFRICSDTASYGRKRIINISKVASSKASSIASDGKKSIKVSSTILNEKWNNLSPRDRKIISEVFITLIEIGLLKSSSKGKRAAFVVLSSITRHQAPGKKDLEEFVEGLQRILKHMG